MGRDCELISPPLRCPVVKALTYTDEMGVQDLRDPLIRLRERDLCNRLARLFHADKIALQTSRDSITGEYV